jgi:hypothetical protein
VFGRTVDDDVDVDDDGTPFPGVTRVGTPGLDVECVGGTAVFSLLTGVIVVAALRVPPTDVFAGVTLALDVFVVVGTNADVVGGREAAAGAVAAETCACTRP